MYIYWVSLRQYAVRLRRENYQIAQRVINDSFNPFRIEESLQPRLANEFNS